MRPLALDLDQTLLRGQALDWALWLAAIERALGVPVPTDEDWGAHPVHTDHGLLDSLSWKLRGRPFGADERPAFEASLFAALDEALATSPGAFLPLDGAVDFVAAVRPRAALATGNLHPVTLRKLRSAGLPTLPCSCSRPGVDRAELVRRALRTLGWTDGTPATSMGDGVWDVRAARELGVGFIGVAGDDAHEARLRAAGARHVVRDYLELKRVLELVDGAEPPAGEQAGDGWLTPREG